MIRIIPAIDVIGGKCVRLSQGEYDSKKVYHENPLDVAKMFEDQGIRYLHLVDLDGAKAKHVVNLKVLQDIASKTKLTVDFGGGIKSDDDIRSVFEAGAAQVTVGSLAVSNPEKMDEWLQEYGSSKIILGADVKDGRIAISGWQTVSSSTLSDFIAGYAAKGIQYVVCTDISKDGMLQGSSIDLYIALRREFPALKFIASGGVSHVEEVGRLNEIGMDGAIIGKAIYEGNISLNDLKVFYSIDMLAKRIIPCLDIKDGQTVKGINFGNIKSVGDPVELGALYAAQGADELVFLDITASHEKRKTLASLVKRIALHINIPFTVGGGVSELADADVLLAAGADKLSINSAAVKNPKLISEIADGFGKQFVVVAIDAKFELGKWTVFVNGGRIATDKELFSWAKEAEDRGAGEILFTSMNHDGVKNGFACDALAVLSESLHIPVIASGGAGSMSHFKEVFTSGKADAGLAASIFHYKEIGIADLKSYLRAEGIPVRMVNN